MFFFQTLRQEQNSNDQFPESPEYRENQDAIPLKVNSMDTALSSPLPPPKFKTSTKRKNPHEERLTLEVMRYAQNRILNSSQDEFDIYGEYVASELRQVKDVHSLLMAKYYINNILIKTRMGKYRNHSVSQDRTEDI